MDNTFPNDADGDALRRVVGDGSDLSKPMTVDFAIAVPDEASGHAVAGVASAAGYETSLSFYGDEGSWTCYCTKVMIASYDNLIREQVRLQQLAEPHGGYADGWGTAGNIDESSAT